MTVKIVCSIPEYNRQGRDMAASLAKAGADVILVQPGPSTLNLEHVRVIRVRTYEQFVSRRLWGIPWIGTILLILDFVRHSVRSKAEVVVAVRVLALIPAVICTLFKRARLVYYSLEIEGGRFSLIERWCCRLFVDAVIGVEETRIELFKKANRRQVPCFVLYNTPPAGIPMPERGRLRTWMTERELLRPHDRIVLFHGSYQSYMRLEEIIRGTRQWAPSNKLVLMIHGSIPTAFMNVVRAAGDRVTMVPPVSPADLFSWIADADIGLLPYEDDSLLAVRLCSPQKLFDLLACGIPFVGSRRPLIQKIADEVECGTCVNMTDTEQLHSAIAGILDNPDRRRQMSSNARYAYETKYNYEALGKSAIDFMFAR